MSGGGGMWSGGEVEQVGSNPSQPKSTSGTKSELYTHHRCECAKPRPISRRRSERTKLPEAFPAFRWVCQIEGFGAACVPPLHDFPRLGACDRFGPAYGRKRRMMLPLRA
jgi:hypothetical protein